MDKPEDSFLAEQPDKASREILADTKIALEIPHYSQLDQKLGIDPSEARSVCALVCIKSVLEYELRNYPDEDTSYDAIKQAVLTHGGKHELGGWRHDAMIDAIRDRGIVAWRRNWLAPTQDPTFFAEHEGYDRAQMAAVTAQIRDESLLPHDRQVRERASLIASLQAGHPVIISVSAGFSENAENHLVVVHGYQAMGGREFFLVTDPIRTDGSHQTEPVSIDFLFDHFNERAIFVAGQSPIA